MSDTFEYVAATAEQIADMADVRSLAEGLEQVYDTAAMDPRMRALAKSRLEESVMWANKGITHSPIVQPEPVPVPEPVPEPVNPVPPQYLVNVPGFEATDAVYSEYHRAWVTKGTHAELSEADGGYGNWGFEFRFPTPLTEGDVVRAQMYVNFQSFPVTEGEGDAVKFLRLRTTHPDRGSDGYMDVYLSGRRANYDRPGAGYYMYKERNGNFLWLDGVPAPDKDNTYHYDWITYLADDPSKGTSDLYIDGRLVGTYRGRTLAEGASSSHFLFGTYWNGIPIEDQEWWFSDMSIQVNDQLVTSI